MNILLVHSNVGIRTFLKQIEINILVLKIMITMLENTNHFLTSSTKIKKHIVLIETRFFDVEKDIS